MLSLLLGRHSITWAAHLLQKEKKNSKLHRVTPALLCCYRETEQSEISSVVLFIDIYDDQSRYVGFNLGILGRVIPAKGKLTTVASFKKLTFRA